MTLLETLKTQTESLKNQYIQMTAEWAKNDFETLRQWAKDYNTGKFGFGEASKKYYRLPHYIVNSYGKVEQHIEKMVKDANTHYETSIAKLAYRIESKGLNQHNLNVVTSHIGVNIETTITDGSKIVRAFTIIAEGLIQRPHYRYLVK
jgi:hypothetical protein